MEKKELDREYAAAIGFDSWAFKGRRTGKDSELTTKRPQMYRFFARLQPILKLHTLMTTHCTINQTVYAHFWRAAMYSVHEKLIR
jgi:hypothetical protein